MAAPIFDSVDVEKNKVTAGLGYVVPFAPYLLCKDSALGRYCANQGLILWICIFLVWVAFGLVSGLLGWFPLLGSMVRFILNWGSRIIRFVLFIGMVYSAFRVMNSGRATEVPVVGGLDLLK